MNILLLSDGSFVIFEIAKYPNKYLILGWFAYVIL